MSNGSSDFIAAQSLIESVQVGVSVVRSHSKYLQDQCEAAEIPTGSLSTNSTWNTQAGVLLAALLLPATSNVIFQSITVEPVDASVPTTGALRTLQSKTQADQDVVLDPAAAELMARHQSLVSELITLVKSEAVRRGMESTGVRISRFDDPEEGDSELVISQAVTAGANEALAYWDCLGRTIEAWVKTLKDSDALVVLERIAVNVEWSDGDPAVRLK
jgi:hypothetical protein